MKKELTPKQIFEFVKTNEEYLDFATLAAFFNGQEGIVTVFVYSDLQLILTTFKETAIGRKQFLRVDTPSKTENDFEISITGYYRIFDVENDECLCYIEKPILLKDELKI